MLPLSKLNRYSKGKKPTFDYDMYFLSCCLYDICEAKDLKIEYNDIGSNRLCIVYVDTKEIYKNKVKVKYKLIIHKIKIHLTNEMKNNLTLKISNKENKKWDLKNIKVYEFKRISYDNLDLDEHFKRTFYEQNIDSLNDKKANNEKEKKDEKKFFFPLEDSEKLRIFVNYFKREMNKKMNDRDLESDKDFDCIKINLVEKFNEMINNKEINQIEFSFILTIFNLSFFTKETFHFFDTFQKINNVCFNELDKDINNFYYINYYEDNESEFIKKFENIYERAKHDNINKTLEEYTKQLENFITICNLKYRDTKTIANQNLINEKEVIKSIINNQTNINNYLTFVISNFNMLYKILNSDKKEEKLLVDPKLIYDSFIFSFFKLKYIKLLDEEEKYQYDSFLDLSEIGNYYMNEFLRNKNIEIKYSDIIAIFIMVVGTKRITEFLNNFSKLNYEFDELTRENMKLKEKFNKILNQYKIDKNYDVIFPKKENIAPTAKISQAFLTVPSSVSNPKYNLPVEANFRTSFEKKKQKAEKDIMEKQINSLDNFITIYQLFYEDTSKIEQKEINNVTKVVNEIINNKKII